MTMDLQELQIRANERAEVLRMAKQFCEAAGVQLTVERLECVINWRARMSRPDCASASEPSE
jgi:hypothetical protein